MPTLSGLLLLIGANLFLIGIVAALILWGATYYKKRQSHKTTKTLDNQK